MTLLLQLDRDDSIYDYIFRLFSQAQTRENYNHYYKQCVFDYIENIQEIPSREFKMAVLDSVLYLEEQDRVEAAKILCNHLTDPEIDFFTSSSIAGVMGQLKIKDCVKPLCILLDDCEVKQLGDTDALALVQFAIQAILDIEPAEIEKRIDESHRFHDTMLNELRKWSEKNLVFVY